MPAMAHIGLGLAAKKIAPEVPVGFLILAAEGVEVVFMGLWALGIENPPSPEKIGIGNYSHSLISGILLTGIAGLATWLISKNKKLSIIIGLLVISHTIMDLIASPMLAFYPNDSKMPVFWTGDLEIGFGLWRYKTLALIIEYGSVGIGLLIYILTKIKIKKTKNI